MLKDKITNLRSVKKISLDLEKELLIRGDAPELSITSLPVFNRKIWGLKRGQLVVIGARTSNCKSAFTLQLVMDMIDQVGKVLFLSLEMEENDIMERMFCNMFKVNNIALLTGKYKHSKELQAKMKSFQKYISETKSIITCGIGATFDELAHMYEMMEEKPDVVVIDYVQGIKTKPRQTVEDISEYVRRTREFAVKNNVCVVMVSQVNRDAKGGEPENYMLKGAGFLEEHADKVILLHWPFINGSEDKNKFVLRLTKNRNGRTGKFDCFYIPEYYRFYDDCAKASIDAQKAENENNEIF